MHEQKASALHNRDSYCIIGVRQIKAREVSKVCYKEFIADHVTFSQSGDGFIVAESFQTSSMHLREPLLCEWLEKAIVCHVIASLGEQKGRHNIWSCFIDKAVA